MQLLKERQQKILNQLLTADSQITTNQLADKLDVSSRTIRNDIKAINCWLQDAYGGEIKTKPRVGVWLEMESQDRELLKEELDFGPNTFSPDSKEGRIVYIIKRLLETDERLTATQLAEELYVSRTTINHDLHQVEDWLAEHNLKLKKKPNWGMKLIGAEKDLRSAVSHLLATTADMSRLFESFNYVPRLEEGNKLYINNLEQIQKIIDQPDLPLIERVIHQVQEEYNFKFTDQAYSGLVIHLAIALRRIKAGESIELPDYDLGEVEAAEEYTIAAQIVQRLEENLEFTIPRAEVGYITLHLLGAKVKEMPNENSSQEVGISLEEIDQEIIQLTRQMVAKAEEVLDISLAGDQQLLLDLSIHLRSAINRLRYNMNLFNPMLDRVRSSYPLTYEAAVAASKLIEDKYGVEMIEDEVGYITIHLQAARERWEEAKQQPLKVLVVCSSGRGTAQLLATKLKRLFKEIEIQGIASVFELEELLAESEPDLIVNTVPLTEDWEVPNLQVSPLLPNADIQRLQTFVGNFTQVQDAAADCFRQLAGRIDPELVFVNQNFSAQQEVIKFLGRQIQDRGYAETGFVDSVLAREELSSTNIGGKIAIPHGNFEQTKESTIAVCELQEPIQWGEKEVKLVFLLVMGLNDQAEWEAVFAELYELTRSQQMLAQLQQVETSAQFLHLLCQSEK